MLRADATALRKSLCDAECPSCVSLKAHSNMLHLTSPSDSKHIEIVQVHINFGRAMSHCRVLRDRLAANITVEEQVAVKFIHGVGGEREMRGR